MERLSVCETTTYRWSFEEDVQNYVSAGFQGIGVWRQKLSDFGEEKGAELLRDSGLKVSSVLWAGGFTGSDGRSYKDSVADAKEAVQLASSLDATCLVVYTGGRAGHTHNHARRLIKGAFKELLPVAADANVTLAVEPMHIGCAAEWTMLTDLDETLEIIAAADSADLKLVFDTYHLAQDVAIIDRIPELVPRIGLVQLGDAKQPPNGEQNRCLLGDGVIPLSEIIATLDQNGYEGCYEIELMGEEVENVEYGELIAKSKHAVYEMLAAKQ